MLDFKFEKDGKERAWIQTPFPVTQNVWAFFMLDTLDPLFVSESGIEGVCNEALYFNRWDNEPVDELAQGQYGKGRELFKHAYLPHCERTPIRADSTGQVHVPENRPFYLTQLQGRLTQNSLESQAHLEALEQAEKTGIEKLFTTLSNVLRTTNEPTTSDIHYTFLHALKGQMLPQYLGYTITTETQRAKESNDFSLGELPVFAPSSGLYAPSSGLYDPSKNPLVSQVALDFARNLDDVLTSPPLRDDDNLIPHSLSSGGLNKIYLEMHKRYKALIPKSKVVLSPNNFFLQTLSDKWCLTPLAFE